MESKKKKRIVVEVAKEKKRVIAKTTKKKKRVEVKVAKKKKWNNKTAKNIQTKLEKAQINKNKAVLLASNLYLKKKP